MCIWRNAVGRLKNCATIRLFSLQELEIDSQRLIRPYKVLLTPLTALVVLIVTMGTEKEV